MAFIDWNKSSSAQIVSDLLNIYHAATTNTKIDVNCNSESVRDDIMNQFIVSRRTRNPKKEGLSCGFDWIKTGYLTIRFHVKENNAFVQQETTIPPLE